MSSIPDIPTILDIFSEIELADGSNLDKKQISKLVKLKRKNKKAFFTVDNEDLIMNAISMIDKLGFEAAFNYLSKTEKTSDIDIIKDSPVFLNIRRNIFIEMTKDMIIKDMTDSVYTCRACDQKKVTVMVVQTRSSDEAASEFFKCENCGHKW